ncbi:hypothetical protein [Marinirhabdus gelatinilytica]|nr:hypothetical protein [Marinirhabdus gelatinilytica]
MRTKNRIPGLKSKWKQILKGTPSKEQLRQFMRDIERQKNIKTANAQ